MMARASSDFRFLSILSLFYILSSWLHFFGTVDGNAVQRKAMYSRAEKTVNDEYNGRGDANEKESLSRAHGKVKEQTPETFFLPLSSCSILTR
jgi:hypothetical protein